jgi:DNA-binding IclR family transcriptional regulator
MRESGKTSAMSTNNWNDMTKAHEKTSAAPQRSIQSIELGFKLIKALETATEPMTLKRLAALAGMPASKAHLYLVSFRRIGLVSQDSDGRYTLGPYALQLGLIVLRRLDLVAVAGEPLRALSASARESVFLSIWSNRGPTIVYKVDGPRSTPMALQVGYVLPLLRSATGRIFLSHLPRELTEGLIREEEASMPQALVKATRANNQSRALMIAKTDSLLYDGFVGLSAPVFGYQNEIAAAVTIIGPRDAPVGVSIEQQEAMLMNAADQISKMIGSQRSISLQRTA